LPALPGIKRNNPGLFIQIGVFFEITNASRPGIDRGHGLRLHTRQPSYGAFFGIAENRTALRSMCCLISTHHGGYRLPCEALSQKFFRFGEGFSVSNKYISLI